jgi:hypothetical protein
MQVLVVRGSEVSCSATGTIGHVTSGTEHGDFGVAFTAASVHAVHVASAYFTFHDMP